MTSTLYTGQAIQYIYKSERMIRTHRFNPNMNTNLGRHVVVTIHSIQNTRCTHSLTHSHVVGGRSLMGHTHAFQTSACAEAGRTSGVGVGVGWYQPE